MPPRPKITREMIVEAAVAIVRERGEASINARAVAEKLHCSTQPVMYQFATMEDLKRAAYDWIDHYHTGYLMQMDERKDPLLCIGLNYIRFAVEEPKLFQFLFQSGYARENNLAEMIDSAELTPVLSAMQEGIGMDMEKTKKVFLTLALCVHGYASLIANNGLAFEEDVVAAHLERVFIGAVMAVREGEFAENESDFT